MMALPKFLRIRFSVLTVLLLAAMAGLGLTALAQNEVDSGTNHALIIGINKYTQWPKLKSPAGDAEALAGILLEKYNFSKANIHLLTDNSKEKPTLLNILTQIDRFVTELSGKDNLLLFFSGHSAEDDDGETYWIPQDGKKKSKLSWLKHSDICNDIFASEDFKAKSLVIITDSLFSHKVIRTEPISLSPYDLRYPEKISEKAELKSREVISFGDQHWAGSKKTQGLGLFTYYLRKALMENELDVIDFENLIFDENILFPVTKIAGTKLLRGRLKSEMDQGGQFIIRKVLPSPIVNVLAAAVAPKKGYPGDSFSVTAKTNEAADYVYIEIGGKRHRMKGQGTDWRYTRKVDKIGTLAFKVAALNDKEIEGKARRGEIVTIRRRAKVANVTAVAVDPASGLGGDTYRFAVTTDEPADKVVLRIQDERYSMQGSGTQWRLSRAIEKIGSIDFSAVAANQDGVQGSAKDGKLRVKAAPINVVELETTPSTGYAGEEFTIAVRTDRSADRVELQLEGKTYAMEGAGRDWRYKRTVSGIGKKTFRVSAKNIEGLEGRPKTGTIVTQKSPLPIPDVAAVDVQVVSPGKGYAGDRFAIRVQTSAPSDTVVLDIDGRQFPMQGSGSDWTYTAKIDKVGISKYGVIARNKDGVQGQSRQGEIATKKIPAPPVNVISAVVDPQRGYVAKEFSFQARTDRPAAGVTLKIDKKSYPMKGSGTNWALRQRVESVGQIEFSVVARNQDNMEGAPQTAALSVFKERFKLNRDNTVTDLISGKKHSRFVDNGDGTITDYATSLMWMQSPKQFALEWNKAVNYCRKLTHKGLSGWRLPTIRELSKLTDKKQKNPALPPGNPFSNVLTHVGYWSKTKHKFGPRYVYQISMWSGKASHLKKSDNGIVWPVRYTELPD